MRIQLFNGGLGNQCFQYIFARHYEYLFPGEIMYLDDSLFKDDSITQEHNGYEIERVFGIRPHFLSDVFDKDVWDHILSLKRGP